MSNSTVKTFEKTNDLSGRVALITGGGTGIGLMIAKAFANRGAKVYVTGRRLDVLQKATTLQFEGSGSIHCVCMDVTDKSSISKAAQVISEQDGKLHILVNNAGTAGPYDPFTETAMEQKDAKVYGDSLFQHQSFEEWQSLFSLNVASIFFVTTAFLGLLEASTKDVPGSTASVINITSGVAHMKLLFGVHCYNATKAAETHLTQVMASDFALKGIPVRVNNLAPGRFLSELTGTQEEEDEDMKKPGLALNPNPRKRTGREEEMGATAVYLASDASGFMNGQSLVIDGGMGMVNP